MAEADTAGRETNSNHIGYLDYNIITRQINQLYSRTYFQGNAFYPTVLCYANGKNVSEKVPLSLLDEKNFKFDSIEAYLAEEAKNLENQNCLDTNDLALFRDISFPNLTNIPLQKTKSVLKSDNGGNRTSSDTVKLSFLWDRENTALSFIDDWRKAWYVNTDRQRILQPLTIGHNPPEGYFGLCYCSIDEYGRITPIGHLSCFGLIPKQVEFDPKNVGPMSTPSGLAKISVDCIYSFMTYVYPVGNKKLKRIFLGS